MELPPAEAIGVESAFDGDRVGQIEDVAEIDEHDYRRPDVVIDGTNSVAVVLGTGTAFYLPKIFLKLRPKFENGEPTGHRIYSNYTDEFDALLKENRESAVGQSGSTDSYLLSCLKVVAYMLRAFYVLPDDVLEDVLSLPETEGACPDWLREVMDVAWGRTRPKGPASPGSGTAS